LQIRLKSKLLNINSKFVSYSNYSLKLVNVHRKVTKTDLMNLFAKLGYAEITEDKIAFVKKIG
jgi:hypothetical protein